MDLDLPHQLIEELGLLLNPADIVNARATCRTWRTHLSQRVNVPPSGGLFQLCALREQDIAQWDQRVASLAAIFPNVKEFEVLVGGRVGSTALSHHLSSLSDAVPALSRLDMRFLLPPPGSGTTGSWLGAQPDGSGPAVSVPQAPLNQLPACVGAMGRLTKLFMEVGAALAPNELACLPPSLTSLRISADDSEHGLTDASLRALSHLSALRHLSAATQPYCVTATGLRALPPGLEHLALVGCMQLDAEVVQALCGALPKLRALSVDAPSDAHGAAAMLLSQHPSLQALSLSLDQDESDADMSIGTVIASCLAANSTSTSAHTTPAASPPASYGRQAGADAMAAMWASSHHTAGSFNPAPAAVAPLPIVPGHSQPMAQLFSQLTLGTSPPPAGLSGGWGSGSMRACLVSLTLQSLTIPPEDRGFLRALAQLRGLHALTIAEPLAQCSVEGDLCVLSALTALRTLCISLMPGAPIPALYVTDDVVESLASHCPHLASLTALAAVPPDLDTSALSRLTALQSLALRPVKRVHAQRPAGAAAHAANVPGSVADGGSSSSAVTGSHGSIAAAAGSLGTTAGIASTTLGSTMGSGSAAGSTCSGSRSSSAAQPNSPAVDISHLPPSLTALSLAMIDVAAPGDPHSGWHVPCASSLKSLSLHECELLLHTQNLGAACAAAGTSTSSVDGEPIAELAGAASAPSSLHRAAAGPCQDQLQRAPSLAQAQGAEPQQAGSQQTQVVQCPNGIACTLHATTALTSLALHEVEGVGDDLMASLLPHLTQLTSLHVLPPAAAQPALSLGGMSSCSALTALKRLSWATWGEGISEDEPPAVAIMAQGARTLHTLRLPPGQAPEVRAQTAGVVCETLPLCSMWG